ncbi:MAG: glycosyltransferase family 39 protein [Flavobacteriales bacterium]|nr:MAG: glycosyltransferase family 39 protein [Flavobacteriales bacterium]
MSDVRHAVSGKWGWLLAVTVIFIVSYFPLFMHLDKLPLRMWDEPRQAIGAYEMLHNGNWLVNHYQGAPDMWSTKPPLLLWVQALFMALLGTGELAARLPSAIAGLGTCLLLLRFTHRAMGSPWPGVVAAITLITAQGYVNRHVTRSGDYDSLLVLFMFWAAYQAFEYARSGERRHMLLLFLALTLGMLTKSVQALMMTPAIGLWWLFTGRLKGALSDRWLWAGLLGFLLVVGGFYGAREAVNPGYLQAVWDNEWGGRYGATLEGHLHDGHYYFQILSTHQFQHGYMLAIAGALVGLGSRDPQLKRLTGFAVLFAVQYLVVISNAGTKTEWYIAPAYPFLCLLAMVVFWLFVRWCAASAWLNDQMHTYVMPVVLAVVLFFKPYTDVIAQTYFPKEWPWDVDYYALPHYMQECAKGKRETAANVLCWDDYNGHIMLYVYMLNDRGHAIESISKHDLQRGMRPVAAEWHVKQFIEEHYVTLTLEESGPVKVYAIAGTKPGAGHQVALEAGHNKPPSTGTR